MPSARASLASTAAVLLLSCGGASGAAQSADGGGGADAGEGGALTTCPIPVALAQPTFARDVLPALQLGCGAHAAATCHGGASPPGHVSYETFGAHGAAEVLADLVGVPPSNAPPGRGWLRVAPGDPSRSWILEKITRDAPGGSDAYGARMPLGAPDVCAPTVETLTAWIAQGAR